MHLNKALVLIYGLFLSLLFSCQEQNINSSENSEEQKTERNKNTKKSLFKSDREVDAARKAIVFQPLLDSLTPTDSAFLPQLYQQYKLSAWNAAEVFSWEKNELYGYPDSIYYLDLKLPNDSLCRPYGKHYQMIFDTLGHLIHEDSVAMAKLLPIWKDQAPVLMTLEYDCQHQGQHHFYKYEKGLMIDIFNVLMESTPPTFDQNAEKDGYIYKPNLLELKLEDRNEDGWNDLVFRGKKLTLKDPEGKKTYNEWYPYKKEKLEYVFLFQKNEDWFIQAQ